MIHSRLLLCLMSAALTLSVAGCAGYRAYQDGNQLIAEGQPVAGLAKLKEASEDDPTNSGYRQAFFTRRDTLIEDYVRHADAAIQAGRFDVAESTLVTAQAINPEDPRVALARSHLERAQQTKAGLDAADLAIKQGKLEDALARVHEVLVNDPNDPRALALQRRITQQIAEMSGRDLGLFPQLKEAYRKPVTLTLNNATILQVFEALKMASGLNFIFDKDVKSDIRTTIQVRNKPVRDIVRLIMASNQLEQRVLDEDTVLIYPNTAAKNADFKELITRSFYLSYADIKQMAALLKSITKAKDIFVDEKLNILIVRDTPEVIALAEKLIQNEDVPDPEVVLELEVLEVAENKLLQLGVQWPSSIAAGLQGKSGTPGQLTLDELRTGGAGIVNITVNNPLISAQLLDNSGDSDMLANPRIRIRNRETARVLIGQRVPVVTSNAVANVGVSQSVSYLDVGLKLEIEPTVSLDEDVDMKVALEVSSIQGQTTLASGTIAYTLGTRNASTVLRVKDNETQVLAGLIQRQEQNSSVGIPVINDIPLLNKLFGQSSANTTRSEVILLITPHIVRSVVVPGPNQTEILSGTENSLGAAPIQLGRTSTTTGAFGVPPPGNFNTPTAPRPQPIQMNPATPNAPPGAVPGAAAPPAMTQPGLIPSAPGSLPAPPVSSTGSVAPQSAGSASAPVPTVTTPSITPSSPGTLPPQVQ
jgi:general secretion pathway protein D